MIVSAPFTAYGRTIRFEMTGPELRLQRQAAGITAQSVARLLQRSPSTVSRLESRRVVRDSTALRYLEAVVLAGEESEARRAGAADELNSRGILVARHVAEVAFAAANALNRHGIPTDGDLVVRDVAELASAGGQNA